MAYRLSKASEARLATCDPRLRVVIRAAVAQSLMDMTVTEGHRPEALQNQYFDEGKSRVRYPNGKHNAQPSKAVDVAPYVNGALSYDQRHCCFLAGVILGIAASLGIKLRWGGNWDRDGEPVTDQDFQDLVHYELVEEGQ